MVIRNQELYWYSSKITKNYKNLKIHKILHNTETNIRFSMNSSTIRRKETTSRKQLMQERSLFVLRYLAVVLILSAETKLLKKLEVCMLYKLFSLSYRLSSSKFKEGQLVRAIADPMRWFFVWRNLENLIYQKQI